MQAEEAAYLFREVIRDVPLAADGDAKDLYITCVEYWDGNLYIGTSAGELLHFVSIPGEEGSNDQQSFILASRLEPPFTTKQDSPYHTPGVQQILLLTAVGKACVLCNGTLTFYTLPEFSPAAFGGKVIKQVDCTWVGGLDRDLDHEEQEVREVAIVIGLKQRLRLIRIGDRAQKTRDIELGGCISIERRGDLACVADGKSYSLLDVVNQQKIDLFPISSAVEYPPPPPPPSKPPTDEDSRPSSTRQHSSSLSARSPVRRPDIRGHERISSLGTAPRENDHLRPDSPTQWPARRSSRESPQRSPLGTPTRGKSPTTSGAERSRGPSPSPEPSPVPVAQDTRPLMPHVATPTPNEYLLTTGTTFDEPGVGMFVNLDGDVVRGTIEFTTYPESVIVTGSDSANPSMPSPDKSEEEGYVLAIVRAGKEKSRVLQTQRWDIDPGEQHASREIISLPDVEPLSDGSLPCVKLRSALTASSLPVPSVTSALSLRRIHIRDPSEEDTEADEKRREDEDQLFARFATTTVKTIMFGGSSVWWLMRNPLLIRLDSRLGQGASFKAGERPYISRDKVEDVFSSLRSQEAKDELDFLTINYIRQKASLILLIDLIIRTAHGVIAFEGDKRFTQDALISSDVEPRIVLSLIPGLRYESMEGPQGIWAAGGLQLVLTQFKETGVLEKITQDPRGAYGDNLLQLLKNFLFAWRKKKGFGSIADEQHVFQTVDAALLHVLLLLDQHSPSGPATAGSLRAELNDVVDHGVDCFDRAIALLEQYKRLYVLSRLYQSRKMVAQVLATWRRILSGEPDEGGELVDGETDVRKYLTRIKDVSLVREYGTWLAARHPAVGVLVFADDSARVKFTPPEVISLLKSHAPNAVKDYLEYLVFGKNLPIYINDLISFYLDTVISEISSSSTSRDLLTNTYTTYRALAPPKPTYAQFVDANAPDSDWHRARLRLLQLIGGSHDAASRYDVDALSTRLEPYSSVLVPEMIILSSRRGEHVAALKLLVHGLGDYDTAIRYCLLGGSSIFSPASGIDSASLKLPSKDEQDALFARLLDEFMKIEDADARLERASELLERFAAWFDVHDVLGRIPEEWPVEALAGFVTHALQKLVGERNESVVLKALAGAQNLRVASEVVEKIEGMGHVLVDKDEGDNVDSAYHSMASAGQDDLDSAVM